MSRLIAALPAGIPASVPKIPSLSDHQAREGRSARARRQMDFAHSQVIMPPLKDRIPEDVRAPAAGCGGLFSAGRPPLSPSPVLPTVEHDVVAFLLYQQRRRCRRPTTAAAAAAPATATATALALVGALGPRRVRNGLPFRFCRRGSLR